MSLIIDTIWPYIGAAPVFIYLLYLIGRTYITTYLSQLGVPEVIKLNVGEYIFYGTRVDTLIIAFLFTAIFIGLIRFLRYKPSNIRKSTINKVSNTKKEAPKWLTKIKEIPEKAPPYFVYSYFIYGAFVFVVSIFSLSLDSAPYHPSQIMLAMIPLTILIIFSIIFLLSDVSYIVWVKARKRMSVVFTVALIIQLAFFPSISSMAWGAFRGYIANDNLKTVEISCVTPLINGIEWKLNSLGIFTNGDSLYLIYGDDQHIIVKSKDNVINVLNTKDILAVNVKEPKLSSIYAPK